MAKKNYEECVSFSLINEYGEAVDYGIEFCVRATTVKALENRVDKEIERRRAIADRKGLDVDDVEWSDPYEIGEYEIWLYDGATVRDLG